MKFNDAMYAKVGLGKAIEEANQAIAAERRSLPGPHLAPGSNPRVDDSHLDVNVQRRLAGITQHDRGVQAAHGGMPIYAKSYGSSMLEDTSLESLKALGVRPKLRGLFENVVEEKSMASTKHAVLASKHDMGAKDVMVVRPSLREASRAADLLKACGYGKTLVQQMNAEDWTVDGAPGIEPPDHDDLKAMARDEADPDDDEGTESRSNHVRRRSFIRTARAK